MRFFLFLCFLFKLSNNAVADNVPEADLKAAQKLVVFLKANDRASVAAMIDFPLQREQPLSSIKNTAEFINHYDEFFNSTNISEIENGLKDVWANWKGTAIGKGSIWISNGKIISINLSTQVQKEAAREAKENEASKLHHSASHYDSVYYECKSKNHHIRIHQNAKKIQYFSWPANRPLSSAPEITLEGKWEQQGNGGNMDYTFSNKEYVYIVEEVNLCGESCDGHLIVKKGDKEILKEVCDPIRK